MNYEACLTQLASIEAAGYTPQHQNSVTLMAYMDNFQNTLPVIHIAGTNGKGSTSAFLASILQAGGIKVGQFNSPHIESPLELTRINGQIIEEDLFLKGYKQVMAAVEEMTLDGHPHPTVFEILTATSLYILYQEKVECAIVEVGMGGSFDSTNVFEQPDLVIITSIDYDHTAILGNTLEAIAEHKAGIIKKNTPVVIAPNTIPVMSTVAQRMMVTGGKMHLIDADLCHEQILIQRPGYKLFHLTTPFYNYKGLSTSMIGPGQTHNLACALLALHLLRKKYPLTETQIKAGIKATKWACRGELLTKDPLILLDGAHNISGVKHLKEMLASYYKDYAIITIFGVLKDKAYQPMLEMIDSISDTLILTEPKSPRKELASKLGNFLPSALIEPSMDGAIEKALEISDSKSLILIAGSLYLVCPARTYLLSRI